VTPFDQVDSFDRVSAIRARLQAFYYRSHHWLILTVILLIAAGLRLHQLGASPLRGDEAFTIRYWTQSLPAVLDSLAGREPHPVPIMLAFGAWKALVGDSEFAMRALPALINLIGIPAMYALGHRLFRDRRIGYVAALAWAINPTQIYHAQDARDYAIWAAFSACALWLLISAVQRGRWLDWALYTIAAVAALYSYFAEASFLLVGTLVVILLSKRLSGQVIRRYRTALLAIGLLSIPWLAQAWAIAHSGYGGTAVAAFVPDLWLHFLPTLTVGEVIPALSGLWPGLAALLAIALLVLTRIGAWRSALCLALAIIIPAVLLTLAATRLAVFRADYLLATAAPLILLLSYILTRTFRVIRRQSQMIGWGLTGLLVIGLSIWPLSAYWQSQKAPDWRALRNYLIAHVQPGDEVIMTTDDPAGGGVDPAFDYYLTGRVAYTTLPGNPDALNATVAELAASHRALWFVPSGNYAGDVDQALRTQLQAISDEGANGWLIREFRTPLLKPDEIDHPLAIQSAYDKLTLRGFSLEQTPAHLTVILYWQPGQATTDTVFIHLIGAINPKTNTPLWTQDDHPPLLSSMRDVYRLDLSGVPAGSYQLQLGLYNSQTGQRRTLFSADQPIGDQAALATISVP